MIGDTLCTMHFLNAEFNPHNMEKGNIVSFMTQVLKGLQVPLGAARLQAGFRNSVEVLGLRLGKDVCCIDISVDQQSDSYFCKVFRVSPDSKVAFEKRFFKGKEQLRALFKEQAVS